MANYLDDLLNDILSEERGVTTTPASSLNKDSDLFYRIKHMNETQLDMLEKQIERRKEQLEESKTKNPYKFPEDDSPDVI